MGFFALFNHSPGYFLILDSISMKAINIELAIASL